MTAAWGVLDHGSFAQQLAPFGPLNGHLIDDYAATSATFGLFLAVAAVRTSWRVPVLAMTAVWTALHAASHIVAADQSTRDVVGPAEAAILVASTCLLALLLRVAARQA